MEELHSSFERNLGVTEEFFSSLFVFPLPDKYCDVTIITADDQHCRAVKVLLALRSQFFDALFFSSFQESKSTLVRVSLSADILNEILEFAYTGTTKYLSSVLDSILPFAGTEGSDVTDTVMTCVEKLISISRGADYCELPAMQTSCAEILQVICDKFPLAVCMVFDAVVKHGEMCIMLSTADLRQRILNSPQEHLMVLDLWPTRRKECAYGIDFRCGVLVLSTQSLRNLFFDCEVPFTYVFQVVYFWATGHLISVKNEDYIEPYWYPEVREAREKERPSADERPSRPVISGLQNPDERWKDAKVIMSDRSFAGIDPLFLNCVAEPSGMMSQDALYYAYRRSAVDNFKLCNDGKK